MDALTFYFLTECPNCDADIHYGPVASLLEHRGLPAITADMMAQTRVDCPECDTAIYFGDLDYYCEGDDMRGEFDEDEITTAQPSEEFL